MKGKREAREAIEEREPAPGEPPALDLDDGVGQAEPDPEYRRRRRPVRVRRNRGAEWARFWRKGWKPMLAGGIGLALAAGAYGLFFQSSWFVLAGSDQIAIRGEHQTDPARVLEVFSSDLGRNVFFIPLEARRRTIESIPWVGAAEVLRLWPARIEVRIQERVPVAFARVRDQLRLIDAGGVMLDQPRSGNFDFPVLTGLAGTDTGDANAPAALALRGPQMKLYAALRTDLDRDGNHHSRDFSEIDLSDLQDVRARVSAPDTVPGGSNAAAATTLIHFGDRNFAARYQLFLSQIAGWRQKYPTLVSVDLHYDGEAIVDPGAPPAVAKPGAAKPGRTAVGGKNAPPATKGKRGR